MSFDVVIGGGRPGKTVVNARVDRGALELAAGHLPDADLVIEAERSLNPLLSGEGQPGEAVESGTVRVTGTPELLERFIEIFHTPWRSRFLLPDALTVLSSSLGTDRERVLSGDRGDRGGDLR